MDSQRSKPSIKDFMSRKIQKLKMKVQELEDALEQCRGKAEFRKHAIAALRGRLDEYELREEKEKERKEERKEKEKYELMRKLANSSDTSSLMNWVARDYVAKNDARAKR